MSGLSYFGSYPDTINLFLTLPLRVLFFKCKYLMDIVYGMYQAPRMQSLTGLDAECKSSSI